MSKLITTMMLALGVFASTPPLHAEAEAPKQRPCAERAQIVATLEGRFAETQRGIGLARPTELVELWVSPKTQSWTLVLTRADGVSCVLARGRNWADDKKPAKGDPA